MFSTVSDVFCEREIGADRVRIRPAMGEKK